MDFIDRILPENPFPDILIRFFQLLVEFQHQIYPVRYLGAVGIILQQVFGEIIIAQLSEFGSNAVSFLVKEITVEKFAGFDKALGRVRSNFSQFGLTDIDRIAVECIWFIGLDRVGNIRHFFFRKCNLTFHAGIHIAFVAEQFGDFPFGNGRKGGIVYDRFFAHFFQSPVYPFAGIGP